MRKLFTLASLLTFSLLNHCGGSDDGRGAVSVTPGVDPVLGIDTYKHPSQPDFNFRRNVIITDEAFAAGAIVDGDTVKIKTADYASLIKGIELKKTILVSQGDFANPEHNRGFVRGVLEMKTEGGYTIFTTKTVSLYTLGYGKMHFGKNRAAPKLQAAPDPFDPLITLDGNINVDIGSMVGLKEKSTSTSKSTSGVSFSNQLLIEGDWRVDAAVGGDFDVETEKAFECNNWANAFTLGGCEGVSQASRLANAKITATASVDANVDVKLGFRAKMAITATESIRERTLLPLFPKQPACYGVPCGVEGNLVGQCSVNINAAIAIGTSKPLHYFATMHAEAGVRKNSPSVEARFAHSFDAPEFTTSIPSEYRPEELPPGGIYKSFGAGVTCGVYVKISAGLGEGVEGNVYAKVGGELRAEWNACADYLAAPGPTLDGAPLSVLSGLKHGALFTLPIVAKVGGEFSYLVDTVQTDELSRTLVTIPLAGSNPCKAPTGL